VPTTIGIISEGKAPDYIHICAYNLLVLVSFIWIRQLFYYLIRFWRIRCQRCVNL